jgi:PAS domain S-box-containing protein
LKESTKNTNPTSPEIEAALEMVRDTEARYQTVAEAASDAIITIDQESTILFLNPAAERIFGYSREEMLGQQLTMLMPEYLRHLHRKGINRYVTTGQRHISWEAVELPGLHKSGKEIPLELSFGEFTRNERRFFTGIVRDMTERKRTERRLATQYTVTRTLAEADKLASAIPRILESICQTLNWEAGVFWRVDSGSDVLRCAEIWSKPKPAIEEFQQQNMERTFVRGEGLPGRVWESGEPAWIPDVLLDPNFPRVVSARNAGLHGGFGFPIFSGNHTLGVIEFFSSEVQEPDQSLLEMMSTIGTQIGQFIERVRSEMHLSASEQRYRYLADSMPQIVWTARPDGHLDYYNRRWFEYSGSTLERSEGWAWQPGVHAEDLERCLELWTKALESGEAFEIEYRIRRASDGVYRWHLGRAVPMRDDGGQIIRWFGTATDIDDRKRAEDSLRFLVGASEMLASSLDYTTTLSNVARLSVPALADWCVIHMVAGDGKLQQLAAAHSNPSKRELLGEINSRYPWGLDVAHGYRLVVSTGVPELISEITDAQLAEVSRSPEHLEMLRALGLRSTLCVPVTARGRTLGAITFASAESERIYRQSDLALAEDLAHRASIAVDNARLYQEAQQANRTKEEFLATLSHELRTPLTPIIGWIHMIRGGALHGNELERGLAVVEKNSQSLARLINDLLDMSAILSGKMRIEKEPVSLDAAIREAVETIRPSATRRGISLDVSFFESDQITVNGDRTRLVQVFWNILANAVKFSSDKAKVRVICNADEKDASVTIEDYGHGIELDFLPFVFERFRQADSSKTRLHGGLGIGLALVKSFVGAHGGRVTVSSEGPGQGSRFTVRLPLTVIVPGKSILQEPKRDADITDAISVLVVEDAPDTLEMLSKVLKSRGFEVRLCESAAEALRAASASSFDVVLSDIGMPDIDGYELMRLIRLLPHMSEVAAIALSGYAAEKDIDAALAAGFDVHLPKPIDGSTLIREIQALVLRKRD